MMEKFRAFGEVVRSCRLDSSCEGTAIETEEGVIYCSTCGREDFSNMKEK
ncbi:hypothetical protein [Risungbinella massiliensis]|nr:hypothetical protein [Risungbinella massiliensis]